MSADLESIKLVTEKSREIIIAQISSFREKRSIVATIIGLDTLFIPFYLSGLQEAHLLVKCASLFPIIIICISLYYFLKIYHIVGLDHGLAVSTYDNLVNKAHIDVLLDELSTNRESFLQNEKKLEKINSSYQRGVNLTIVAVILSIIVLSLNLFCKKTEDITKVEIVNLKSMPNSNSNNNGNSGNSSSTSTSTQTSSSPVVIPPPSDRQSIKENNNNQGKKK